MADALFDRDDGIFSDAMHGVAGSSTFAQGDEDGAARKRRRGKDKQDKDGIEGKEAVVVEPAD
eukprot:2186283-Lingulodinium_polyedra.AAC.1